MSTQPATTLPSESVTETYRLLAENRRLVDGLEAIVRFIDAVQPKPSKEMYSIRATAQALINDARANETT
jgi:hypothetical protein